MNQPGIDFYQVQTIISFAGIFILAVITLLKAPGNRLNISAAVFFILVSLWQLDLFIIRGAPSPEVAGITSRTLRPALFFLTPALLSFAILLTKTGGKILYLEKALYITAAAGTLMCVTGFGFKPMIYKPGIGYDAQADLTYLLIIINTAVSVTAAFTVLLRKFFSGDILPMEKKQLQYLMLGVAIGLLGALTNILNIYGVKVFPMAGFLVLVFFALMSYSILAHDLMNIRELFQKTLIYAITSGLIVLIYFIMNALVFSALGDSVYKTFLFFLCTLFIVIGFEPTLKALDKVTRKAFFISSYDYQALLQQVLFKIRFLKDFGEIFTVAGNYVANVLQLENSAFFFWETGRDSFLKYPAGGPPEAPLPINHPLIAYMDIKRDIIYFKKMQDDLAYNAAPRGDYSGIDMPEIVRLLKKYSAEICVPVLINGEVKGIWVIGKKTSKATLLREEVNWIKNIAAQISVILENIILYSQLLKSERYAILGRMSAAVAHEIRNPLTGLNGFVQMVNADRGNADVLDKFLSIAPGEFKRLERLTDNLLALSRTTTVRQEPKDLSKIIDETLDFTSHILRDLNIRVSVNYFPVPKISVETEQIKQLALNIIMNACQAINKDGALDITVSEGRISGRRYVIGEFSDSGPGIDREIYDRVFEPFFTTKAEGTGLGLAISKNIMEAHGGLITLENKEGSGCVVSIFFPIV